MSKIKLEKKNQNRTVILTINNETKHNMLELDLISEMEDIIDELSIDKEIRVLIITGSGEKTFCAGFDVRALPKPGTNKDDIKPDNPIDSLMDKIDSFKCPVIARINGSAFGGGVELICTADFRIANSKAKFAIPPAKLGIMYPQNGLHRFLKIMGINNAKYLLFTGSRIDSQKALDINLVDKLCDYESLDQSVNELSDIIINNAPIAIEGMKKQINYLVQPGYASPEYEKEIKELQVKCFTSQDYLEGIMAFMQKRNPDFKGE